MIYLRADTKSDFDTAMIDAGWTSTEDGEVLQLPYSHTHSLDIIGKLFVETGQTVIIPDEEGDITTNETVLVVGYHANLMLHGEDLPQSMADLVISTPANPQRMFS